MPKITKNDDGTVTYKCTCGMELTYETDDKNIKKVKKCFKCQNKIEEIKEYL